MKNRINRSEEMKGYFSLSWKGDAFLWRNTVVWMKSASAESFCAPKLIRGNVLWKTGNFFRGQEIECICSQTLLIASIDELFVERCFNLKSWIHLSRRLFFNFKFYWVKKSYYIKITNFWIWLNDRKFYGL